MKIKLYLKSLIVAFIAMPLITLAQGVAINEDDSPADPSAMMDVKSSDKGILIPRVQLDDKTTADPISNPSEGLLVYNETGTEAKGFWYWAGTEWVQMQTTASSGSGLVGSIISYAGISVPSGYLVCDVSTISRTTYANLFASLGTSWGAGDGSTTFNLPDLRGRFMRGVDNGAGNDPNAGGRSSLFSGGNIGDNVGSYQTDATSKNGLTATADNAGAHSHTHNRVTRQGSFATLDGVNFNSGGNNQYLSLLTANTSTSGNHTHNITIGNGDAETRPINASVYYIIKY